jgi:multimeric flavodoxin WrbA
MKAIAFNGSPRKNWNTVTLLEKAFEGAATQGAEPLGNSIGRDCR